MNTFKKIVFLVFIMLLFNQCKNDNVNTENTLIMEIDGIRYETQQVNMVVVRVGTLFSVEITANFPDRKDRIFLKIYSFSQQGSGTYMLGGLEQNQITYANDGNFVGNLAMQTNTSCIASQGNFIQITDFDGQILNGNFSATVCKSGTSKNIVNGQLLRLYVR
jgi:hypothetical protein